MNITRLHIKIKLRDIHINPHGYILAFAISYKHYSLVNMKFLKCKQPIKYLTIFNTIVWRIGVRVATFRFQIKMQSMNDSSLKPQKRRFY